MPSRRSDLRLGIDVGGTHTDAVVLDRDNAVVAKTKQPDHAGRHLRRPGRDRRCGRPQSRPAGSAMSCSAPPTPPTRCWSGAACTRSPYSVSAPRPRSRCVRSSHGRIDLAPRSAGMPSRGRRLEYDGREIVPFDEDATRDFFDRRRRRVDAVAVDGSSHRCRPTTSSRWRDIARDVLGDDVDLSLTHEIGSLGPAPPRERDDPERRVDRGGAARWQRP